MSASKFKDASTNKSSMTNVCILSVALKDNLDTSLRLHDCSAVAHFPRLLPAGRGARAQSRFRGRSSFKTTYVITVPDCEQNRACRPNNIQL